MRVSRSDIDSRIEYANDLLAVIKSDIRLKYYRSNGWHVIEELSVTDQNPYSGMRRASGTIGEM